MKTSPNPSKKKARYPVQIILVILVLAAVVVAVLITGPTDDTVNPVPPTATPIPTAFALSPVVTGKPNPMQTHQTDGVIIGTATVLIILLVGTALAIAPSLKQKQP